MRCPSEVARVEIGKKKERVVRGSFEFILGMYSIIIALGISRLLEGVKNVAFSGRPLQGSGLYIGMLAMGLLVHGTTWLSLWPLRDVETWKAWSFLQLMLAPIMLYLYSSVTVPDDPRSIDMGEHYVANARKMHGLLIAAILFNGFNEFVMLGYVYNVPLAALRLTLVALLLVCAALPRALLLHRLIVPAGVVGSILLVPFVHSPIE